MGKGRVLVTGASGYIAGFAIRQLLAEGWTVRGTLRDLKRAAEVRAAVGSDDIELVAANLMADAGWAEAMAGIDHVLHMASPLPDGEPKNPDDLIVPARDGALRALRAARDAGVKRLVMTSSTAAICYGGPPKNGVAFTEADWTDVSGRDAYAYIKSKTIAERAARDWVAEDGVAAEGGALEFVTVNPSLVLGPLLGKDYSPSLQVVKKLLDGDLPGLPRLGFAVVDVRDLADLHIRAMVTPGLHGERFMGSGEWMWLEDVAAVLKSRLGADAAKVPTRRLPALLVKLSALFDPTVRMVVPELGRERPCDATHAREMLGWTSRPAADSIEDCARSLVAMRK
ncbi:dihydroflavonol-4-reductase [Polymorphobacter multimanifer]|uniref:Dihydroflavonol-4-reductase n=1 Tax=Polymorphobacter multimanifer TaxID=1070431 RepID=A0A841L6X6_9SPHN|nr:NAD-dependent epimerase/dehydratase family protein [Polymorphobacter multimanifer]MBB6228729.1 dihydroflavonol-4-reductase [Polymorphobacter multimanifer]GGI83754.1 dihydroflavonol-4-reductase [Polymorphobacter multimanifer]